MNVEAESIADVKDMLLLATEHVLRPVRTVALAGATNAVGVAQSADTAGASALPVGGPLQGGLLDFGSEGEEAAEPQADAGSRSVIWRVLKRKEDSLVLSPKFPRGPDGSEQVEKAAMVILAGFDADGAGPVTGSRLLKSLKHSGYILDRVDTELEDLAAKGQVLTEGVRRAKRYFLSEPGRVEALRLAGELAALRTVPAPAEAAA